MQFCIRIFQVTKDFSYLFADNNHSLAKAWPALKGIPSAKFQITLDPKITDFSIDQDIYDILAYLKMINTHKVKFHDAVKALITFSGVNIYI